MTKEQLSKVKETIKDLMDTSNQKMKEVGIKEIGAYMSYMGEVVAYGTALAVIEEYEEKDTEPVGISDRLTLEELTETLRKMFPFKYLTIHHIHGCYEFILHENSPFFDSNDYKWKSKGVAQIRLQINDTSRIGVFLNRDFSKCIVEVK